MILSIGSKWLEVQQKVQEEDKKQLQNWIENQRIKLYEDISAAPSELYMYLPSNKQHWLENTEFLSFFSEEELKFKCLQDKIVIWPKEEIK